MKAQEEEEEEEKTNSESAPTKKRKERKGTDWRNWIWGSLGTLDDFEVGKCERCGENAAIGVGTQILQCLGRHDGLDGRQGM